MGSTAAEARRRRRGGGGRRESAKCLRRGRGFCLHLRSPLAQTSPQLPSAHTLKLLDVVWFSVCVCVCEDLLLLDDVNMRLGGNCFATDICGLDRVYLHVNIY